MVVAVFVALLVMVWIGVVLGRKLDNKAKQQEIVLIQRLKKSFAVMDDFLQASIETIVVPDGFGFAGKGAIFLLDDNPKTAQLKLACTHNLNATFTSLHRTIELDHSLTLGAVKSRVIELSGLNQQPGNSIYQDLDAHGHYSIPVIQDGQLLAVVLIFVGSGHRHNDKLQKFLQKVAEVIALGISQHQAQLQINRDTNFDQITTLPNRYLLMDRLNQALFVAWRQKVQHAMLYVVIDHWQTLLAEHGRSEIDLLYQQIGQKFTDVLREEDTVASLGDGVFAILLSHIDSDNEVATTEVGHVLNKLTGVFEQVFVVAQEVLLLSSSVGVAMIPSDGDDAQAIMKNAEKAAKRVAQRGGDGFAFYAEKLQKQSDFRFNVMRQLQQALDADQFQVHYQAIVTHDGQIIGVEALLYWQHPEQGLVGPEQFIPIAEECGLIKQIGTWVLQKVSQQFVEFRKLDVNGQLAYIAVNISAHQFHAPGFYQVVNQVIRESGIEPEQLMLEITESLMHQDIERTSKMLLQLSALGVAFTLDDFGTGYSSLTNLGQLPIRQLKIDQSFVDNVNEIDARRIIEMIITMAGYLDAEVIAKGVETSEQQHKLYKLGCLKYQGFLFNKPVSADEFSQLLAQEQESRAFAVL